MKLKYEIKYFKLINIEFNLSYYIFIFIFYNMQNLKVSVKNLRA